MKVLVIHTNYKTRGGEDSVVFNEMKLLTSNGVSVELLSFTNETGAVLKFVQLPFNIDSYRKTRRKVRNFRPDIVHIHNLHFAGSASIISALKKEKVPFVLTLHNYRLLCPSATLFKNGKIFLNSVESSFPWSAVFDGVYKNSRFLTLWLGISMFLHQAVGTWKSCRRFIVLSEHSKELIMNSKLKKIGNRIVIKPNFCYDPSLAISGLNNYFLYVGRLSEEKGILLLLNAFSACGLPLKIVGGGPLKHIVTDYSSRFKNIEFLESVPKHEVFDLLRNCSALVCPSVGYETFGMVVIEAFSAGKPVIASRLGAMENLVTDQYNGMFFAPGSEDDLKLKIMCWQSLKEEVKDEYRKNARLTYERYYTPEKNASQLLAIYQSVLKEEGVKRV
ncbi:MAG TPA: glycosyltransferase family 4 protein [Chitinophagaceae bacterium]|jgi:glycosyltransferase involved in cell wall biosynthesis|nr:glycosyltransferase family 4 protein [Chitinophagaceae bacterium]